MTRYIIAIVTMGIVLAFYSRVFAADLSYATFIGGTASDAVYGLATDREGYYTIDSTSSSDYPIEITGYQTGPGPGSLFGDGVVVRYDHDHQPVSATLFGGNYVDDPVGLLALDDGVVTAWITQSTNLGQNYPNAPPASAYGDNIVIVKYSLDLSEVLWAYSIAGNGYEYFMDIDASTGRIVLLGATESTNLAVENPPPSGGYRFVVILDSASGELQRFRRLMPGADYLDCEALDDGSLLLAGVVGNGTTFTPTPTAVDTVYSGSGESFLIRMDASLNQVWLTYLGGNSYDSPGAVEWDPTTRSIIVALATSSPDLPVLGTHWQNDYQAQFDVFLCAVDEQGQSYLWSGYLGGSGQDGGGGPLLSLDNGGNLVVAMSTVSLDLPQIGEAIAPPPTSGAFRGYMAVMSITTGSMLCSTYLPGDTYQLIEGLGVRNGAILLAGWVQTNGPGAAFTPTADAFDSTIAGYSEGYILEISQDDLVPVEPLRFIVEDETPRMTIRWPADDHAYLAEVLRGSRSEALSVQLVADEWRLEDSRTSAQQQDTNLYRIHDLTEDSRLVFEYTHQPTRLVLDSMIAISVTPSEVVLFSPSFTADPTILSIYDLRGHRLLRRNSRMAAKEGRTAHVIPLSALGRLPNGRYIATAEYGDHRATGRFVLCR